MRHLKEIEDRIAAWPHVSVHPHRFGGREFRYGKAEVGHVHAGGVVDIPFPRSIRDALLAGGLAEEHHWVPNSGWITFRVRSEADFEHALWLMRLSYVRYALKKEVDARGFFDRECERLHLNSDFRARLEKFVPLKANQAAADDARAVAAGNRFAL